MKYGLIKTFNYTIDLLKSINRDIKVGYADELTTNFNKSRTFKTLNLSQPAEPAKPKPEPKPKPSLKPSSVRPRAETKGKGFFKHIDKDRFIVEKQGAKDIPTNVTLFKNNELFIQIDALQFIYKGTRQSSDAIYGQVTQRGMILPLNLQKMLKEDSVIPKKQEPSKPYPYYSEEVTIENKEQTLSGTLTLPKKEGKFPCVVLISGSGPQNRDEELLRLQEQVDKIKIDEADKEQLKIIKAAEDAAKAEEIKRAKEFKIVEDFEELRKKIADGANSMKNIDLTKLTLPQKDKYKISEDEVKLINKFLKLKKYPDIIAKARLFSTINDFLNKTLISTKEINI
jgi:hypothetical protein